MATIEARGFVNRLTINEYSKGQYAKFDLAVQQTRKDNTGIELKETIYFRCTDFAVGDNTPADGEYVGVTGYVRLSKWDGGKDGKGGVNVDVTVKSYEKLEQKTRTPKANTAPPSDPFKLSPDKP